jgi:hypothetical protein
MRVDSVEQGRCQSNRLFASARTSGRAGNFQPRFTVRPNARAKSIEILAEPYVPKTPLRTDDSPLQLFGPSDVPVRIRVCRVAKLA